jgi:sugar phosphate isomerase/epimerase
VTVASYAGYFGDTAEEFRAAAEVATGIGTTLLSGSASLEGVGRPALISILETSGVRLAIENHAEKTPGDILEQIGDDGHGLIGTAVDSGWWGTQGFDAADAIRELGANILHVHFKDVLAVGAHDTCALGDGIVPIRAVVQALSEIGFSGPISIEHEPEHSDPAPAVAISKERLSGWLAEFDRPQS